MSGIAVSAPLSDLIEEEESEASAVALRLGFDNPDAQVWRRMARRLSDVTSAVELVEYLLDRDQDCLRADSVAALERLHRRLVPRDGEDIIPRFTLVRPAEERS